MGIGDIVINNLKRQKGKVLFLIVGVVVGITTVVALFSLTTAMNNKMNKDIEEAGTKVLVFPQAETASFSFGGITVASKVAFDTKEMPDTVVNVLKDKAKTTNIKYIAPKKIYGVEVNGQQTLIVGVDFQNELKVKPWLKINGKIPKNDKEILLGSGVAASFNKKSGDTLKINNQEFQISGVIGQSGDQEDGIIMAPLLLVEKLSGNKNLSLVELIIKKTPDFEVNVEDIKTLLPETKVTPVKEVMESRNEVIKRFEHFAILVSIIILLVAVLIVLTTMMGSVSERMREIGLFRAIGFRKRDIMNIVLLEAVLICAIGGIIGYLGGILVAKAAIPFMGQAGLIVDWNPFLGIVMVLLAVIIGFAASWFPAAKAAALDPQDALRYL